MNEPGPHGFTRKAHRLVHGSVFFSRLPPFCAATGAYVNARYERSVK